MLAASATAANVGPQSGGRQAYEHVARAFVHSAVQRRHPERAWTLVTPAIRFDTTRAQWNAGTMRVVPVLAPKSLLVRFRVLERRPATVLLLAGLRQRGEERDSRGTFLIRLVDVRGRWLVSYWGPAMLIAPKSQLTSRGG